MLARRLRTHTLWAAGPVLPRGNWSVLTSSSEIRFVRLRSDVSKTRGDRRQCERRPRGMSGRSGRSGRSTPPNRSFGRPEHDRQRFLATEPRPHNASGESGNVRSTMEYTHRATPPRTEVVSFSEGSDPRYRETSLLTERLVHNGSGTPPVRRYSTVDRRALPKSARQATDRRVRNATVGWWTTIDRVGVSVEARTCIRGSIRSYVPIR